MGWFGKDPQHLGVDTSVTHDSGNYEPLSAAFEAAIAAQHLWSMQAVHLGDGTIVFSDVMGDRRVTYRMTVEVVGETGGEG
jgi:predicted HAD superfamily phosphohydrolase YqeG